MAKISAVVNRVVIPLFAETVFFGAVMFSNLLVNVAEMGWTRDVLGSFYFLHYLAVCSHSGAPFQLSCEPKVQTSTQPDETCNVGSIHGHVCYLCRPLGTRHTLYQRFGGSPHRECLYLLCPYIPALSQRECVPGLACKAVS